jgi:sortase A
MTKKKQSFVALIILGATFMVAAVWFGFLSGYLTAAKETQRANDLLAAAPKSSVEPSEEPSELLVEGVPTVGEYFAVMRIPALGKDWLRTVSEGTTPEVLNHLGVGHYEGTELPGEPGNFAVAGHSGSSWTPFAKLDSLVAGDLIEVETLSTKFTYEVLNTEVVEETDVNTVYENPKFGTSTQSDQWLTITTCITDGPKNLRYVVYAKLINQSVR